MLILCIIMFNSGAQPPESRHLRPEAIPCVGCPLNDWGYGFNDATVLSPQLGQQGAVFIPCVGCPATDWGCGPGWPSHCRSLWPLTGPPGGSLAPAVYMPGSQTSHCGPACSHLQNAHIPNKYPKRTGLKALFAQEMAFSKWLVRVEKGL